MEHINGGEAVDISSGPPVRFVVASPLDEVFQASSPYPRIQDLIYLPFLLAFHYDRWGRRNPLAGVWVVMGWLKQTDWLDWVDADVSGQGKAVGIR